MTNELDILNTDIGGIKIRAMTAITFFQWIAQKINGSPAYKAASVELAMLVSNPPLSRTISDDEKLRIISKLTILNIPIK